MFTIINFVGGPGSGKSTMAASVFADLKNQGVRAELVHEAAKKIIYRGATAQLDNQVAVLGKQWSQIEDLKRAGAEAALADSPLLCGLLYGTGLPYAAELRELVVKLDSLYPQINIFVRRVKPFSTFGRTQANEAEAHRFDFDMRELFSVHGKKIDFEADGNAHGQARAGAYVLSRVLTPGTVVQEIAERVAAFPHRLGASGGFIVTDEALAAKLRRGPGGADLSCGTHDVDASFPSD